MSWADFRSIYQRRSQEAELNLFRSRTSQAVRDLHSHICSTGPWEPFAYSDNSQMQA